MLEGGFEHRPWPDTIVALHVETTGGRSERQRIVWISLTRIVGRQIEQTWESFVNPQVRVPQHVARRLGLDRETLDSAPLAQDALIDARSVIGEDALVGHDVLAHVGPLDCEPLWHGPPPLKGDLLDTKRLAAQRCPNVPRPTLEAIARREGLCAARRPLAGSSRLVADVYLALSRGYRNTSPASRAPLDQTTA